MNTTQEYKTWGSRSSGQPQTDDAGEPFVISGTLDQVAAQLADLDARGAKLAETLGQQVEIEVEINVELPEE